METGWAIKMVMFWQSALLPYYLLDAKGKQKLRRKLMSQKCAKPSTEARAGIERISPMVSSLFLVQLKWSARLSVLKHLGIGGRCLRNMRITELRTLSLLLAEAMTQATQELGRRSGLKT
jgi:hypothetical protein